MKKKGNPKKYGASNPESLRKFYSLYDTSYWLRRTILLEKTYKNIDEVTKFYDDNFDTTFQADKDNFRKGIAIDIHFLGYQMIETLFEIIFAILKDDPSYLWLWLSESDWSKHYNEDIPKIAKGDLSCFGKNQRVIIEGKKVELDTIRWLFYFNISDPKNIGSNIKKIKSILTTLAKIFSDRDAYNSFKHSIRLYNSKFSFGIGLDNNSMHTLSNTENSITYLTTKQEEINSQLVFSLYETTEPIDIDRDIYLNNVVYELIYNIIELRKPNMQTRSIEEVFTIQAYDFSDIDIKNLYPKTGIFKSSWTL